MEKWEELRTLAKKAGREDLADDAMRRSQDIMERAKTGVFVTGGISCGKTTILNGITGVELREPSVLSGEEKPLRVMFEKVQEDSRFECRTVADRKWYDEDAILYEMKLDDILQEDGRLNELADLADVVFYVVSAVAPLTSKDMDAMRALSFLKIQVVLSKMDILDEESVPKVEKYVEGACEKLGLAPPIVLWDVPWEQAAKTFRMALPSWDEREALRKEHVRAVRREAAEKLQEEVRNQRHAQQKRQEQEKKDRSRKALETQEQQALWGKLRAQMQEQGGELTEQVKKDMEKAEGRIREKLYAVAEAIQFDEELMRSKIPLGMKKEMQALVEAQKKRIENRMQEDCRRMMERAVNLGLTTGFDLTDTDFALMTTMAKPDYEWKAPQAVCSGDARILLGAGVAAGLFLLLPVPTALGVAGSVAAAGIGGSAYIKEKKKTKEQFWKREIRDYCRENLKNLEEALAGGVKDYYGRLADALRKKAEDLELPHGDEGDQNGSEELAELLGQCEELLKNMG